MAKNARGAGSTRQRPDGHITNRMRQASAQRMEDYITRLKQ